MSEGNQNIELERSIEIEETLPVLERTMDKFLAAADVNAVYGEIIQQGETMILPTAEILTIAGFGVGTGSGRQVDNEDEQYGSGGGGGGGGRVLSRPVAVIINSPDGVFIEPVVDVTKIALAAFTAAGFMVGMIAKMLRSK